ncbi:MAG TPA: polysaccharide biosynthesis/export family protein [Geobacteraceae bacterium]|nr:polysaccharide biosynthesis/export family protein [Geobacteraceae bacterium]
MNMRVLTVCFLLLLFPVFAWGGDYVIGEGDTLDISVWGVKELNFPVKVRPDGKITVPGLGDVTASGYTPVQLENNLKKSLRELIKNPIVTVTVKDITNSKVYVFGGGVKAGVYDLVRRTSLLQLLCQVGELKTADLKRAYVLRDGKKIKQNFYNLFMNGDTADDIVMESNDSIFIPQLADKNIYVLGAVTTPKLIEYREGMTVMEAILDAGGFTKFAKQNAVSIMRKDGNKEVSIPVKAKDLINNGDLHQNVRLQPGDYVVIEEGMF